MRQLLAIAAILTVPSFANAECKSTYWPLKAGNTWSYANEDGTQPYASRVVKVDGDRVTFESATVSAKGAKDPKAANDPNDATMSFEGVCLKEGLRVNMQMSGTSEKGNQAKLETASEEGYSFPADGAVKLGAEWTETRVMKMSAGGGDPKAQGIAMKMVMKTKHKIAAKESVKVPAGTFDAFKVVSESETTMEMEGPMAAMMKGMAGAPQKSTHTMWIAKGVGMVKQEAPEQMGPPAQPGAAPAAAPKTRTSVLTAYKVK